MESEPFAQELTDQDRVLLVFAYLGPLALLSLIAAAWIASRGLYLLVREKLWALLGVLFWTAAGLTALGLALLVLFCVVRALEGERFKIPLLGDLVDSM